MCDFKPEFQRLSSTSLIASNESRFARLQLGVFARTILDDEIVFDATAVPTANMQNGRSAGRRDRNIEKEQMKNKNDSYSIADTIGFTEYSREQAPFATFKVYNNKEYRSDKKAISTSTTIKVRSNIFLDKEK